MSPWKMQTNNNIIGNLSKVKKKMENDKSKLVQEEHINQEKAKADEIKREIINFKYSSQINTKKTPL